MTIAAEMKALETGKRCTSCRIIQSFTEYSSHPLTKDGKQSWCKECTREANRTKYVRKMDAKKHGVPFMSAREQKTCEQVITSAKK